MSLVPWGCHICLRCCKLLLWPAVAFSLMFGLLAQLVPDARQGDQSPSRLGVIPDKYEAWSENLELHPLQKGSAQRVPVKKKVSIRRDVQEDSIMVLSPNTRLTQREVNTSAALSAFQPNGSTILPSISSKVQQTHIEGSLKKNFSLLENSSTDGPTHTGCHHLTDAIYYEYGKYPLTALASYPGSGNGFTRGLIVQLTGIYTGDVYGRVYENAPGFSPRTDTSVVVVKTHFPVWEGLHNDPVPSKDPSRKWKRAILIIRHPLDSIRSFWSWQHTGSHVRTPKSSDFLIKNTLKPKPGWLKYAQRQVANWLRFIRFWVVQFDGPVHIVVYENLKTNLKRELKGIRDFLKTPAVTDVRLQCTLRNTTSVFDKIFLRTARINKRIIYDDRTKQIAEQGIHNLTRLLRKHYSGYPTLRLPMYYFETRKHFS